MVLHYITVATKPHPILENIKKQVNANKEKIEILGIAEDRYIGWQSNGNFGMKLREVHDYIFRDEIEEKDIILFTDAYDVIYSGNLEEIEKKYRKFEKPIVFGGETECNPLPILKARYPNEGEKFRYLNSGMFIGTAEALRKCMEGYVYDDRHDDQLFWTYRYLERDLIEIDYKNELFLNTHGLEIEDIKWNRMGINYNGKRPNFIHVNGPDKEDLNKFL